MQITHPGNLACHARLFGLQPADIETCRVLEIGCGNGINLLSLAQILPGAQFIGIDDVQRQIEHGIQIAQAIGCSNVELRAMSVADLHEQLGKFDYILCHGVYSWVPPEIAAHVLRAIQTCLKPQGVAYISYNIYPGWHLRGIVREIMCRETASWIVRQ